jgi:hypothetical protein
MKETNREKKEEKRAVNKYKYLLGRTDRQTNRERNRDKQTDTVSQNKI